jgi:hypothetical protein
VRTLTDGLQAVSGFVWMFGLLAFKDPALELPTV